jgi:hypothetical protein
MDLKREIARHAGKLAPEMQEQVLKFVLLLSGPPLVGEEGANLRQFAGTLDPVSAGEMMQAIEEECERVGAGEWQVSARHQQHHPLA